MKKLAVLMLAMQLFDMLFYLFILRKIHPVKILVRGSETATRLVQYTIDSKMDFSQLFLGLGLLILSYISWTVCVQREEQSFTV